jgi:hypothetical protein
MAFVCEANTRMEYRAGMQGATLCVSAVCFACGVFDCSFDHAKRMLSTGKHPLYALSVKRQYPVAVCCIGHRLAGIVRSLYAAVFGKEQEMVSKVPLECSGGKSGNFGRVYVHQKEAWHSQESQTVQKS